MSRARTSGDIWWARILDRIDEILHKYPKLPKNLLTESSLPYRIGTKITIENYNTFLHNYGSSGYKFQFQLDSDNKTGEVYIISMTSTGNPHARIMCEVAAGQSVGQLGQKCFTWMIEPYIRAVISIKILDPRPGVREPGTGYFFRSMTAKLYRQGMAIQRWDFGNVRKNSRDPIGDINNPALCNAPNDPSFQINIPISEVFWDPPSPISPTYVPVTPANIIGNNFSIDLYRIQRVALEAKM